LWYSYEDGELELPGQSRAGPAAHRRRSGCQAAGYRRRLGITERSAYSIVTDLAAAGYVIKQKDGRRNRYQVQAHLPLPDPVGREPVIGDVLAVLMGEGARQQPAWAP
jgi:hypothetical protein